MKKQIVNLKDLTEVLGCSKSHIYTLISRGMPYHQLDPRANRYFVVDEVIEWLKTTGLKQVTTWR